MKIKKICFLCAVLICSGVVFTGCSKDDDGSEISSVTSINAKVENGSDYNFDKVKAVAYYDDFDNEYIYGESNYTNGGFKFDLPKTVDEKYLTLLYLSDEEAEWMTISNKNVMGTAINFEAYKWGNCMGKFYYGSTSKNITSTNYSATIVEGFCMYVNKDITIKGSATETEEIDGVNIPIKNSMNVVLRKGWNIMYIIESLSAKISGGNITSASGTYTGTTQKPCEMKWYYEDDFESYLDLGVVQKPSQPEINPKFSVDLQKLVSKYWKKKMSN